MLITPPVVALVAAGPDPLGLLALLGWFLAYCARGPVEVLRGTGASGRAGMAQAEPAVARFWLIAFGLAALLLLGRVLYLRPQALGLLAVAGVLLFFVQWLADRGLTRSILAGLLAVAGLMAGGPLYYLAALGSVPPEGWALAGAAGAFFAGSIFRVKTLARERRSPWFRVASVGLHAAAVAVALAWAWQGSISYLVAVALELPLLWSVYGAVRAGRGTPVSLLSIGKGEQWLTILFGVLLMVALR